MSDGFVLQETQEDKKQLNFIQSKFETGGTK